MPSSTLPWPLGKAAIILSIALAMLICLAGCEMSTPPKDPDDNAEVTFQDIPSEEHAASLIANKYYTLDELIALGPDEEYIFRDSESDLTLGICEKTVFLKQGDSYYPLAWQPPTSDFNYKEADAYPIELLPSERYEGISGVNKPDEQLILTIDRSSGDQLVTFQDVDEYTFESYSGGKYIDEERYLGSGREQTPETLLESLFAEAVELNGVKTEGDMETIVQILQENGVTAEIPNPELPTQAPSLCSSTPTSIIVGKYKGTQFVEETLSIEKWFSSYGEPKYYAPTTKTKEGYFVINYSNIPSGIYSFANGLVKIVDTQSQNGSGVKPTVDGYSWAELSEIAEEISISKDKKAGIEVAKQYHLCNEDGTLDGSQFKTIELKDGAQVQAQLIGIYHDDKSTGGKAGLTFLLRNCPFKHALSERGYDDGNVGGWKKCIMRSWLNNEVLDSLPNDLSKQIVEVNKSSNNKSGETTSASSVSPTADKLWLPSCVELFGQNQESGYSAINAEGYQYELFDFHRVNWEGDDMLDKNINGVDEYNSLGARANIWWTRSPNVSDSYYWYRVHNGKPDWDYGTWEEGVAFGFCL